MKRLIAQTILTLALILLPLMAAIGQPPPPGHGLPDDQPAPIGGGVVVLLLMAGAYGAKKVYDARKKIRE